MKNKDVSAIMFILKVESQQLLFLMLGEDGNITRMGNGNFSKDPLDKEMYIAITKEEYFSKIVSLVSSEFFKNTGKIYQVDQPKGRTCELQILLKFKDGKETGVGFIYGTESRGVPSDIGNLVSTAVNLTDPWYQEYKEKVRGSRK
jgi:hypothetical protein